MTEAGPDENRPPSGDPAGRGAAKLKVPEARREELPRDLAEAVGRVKEKPEIREIPDAGRRELVDDLELLARAVARVRRDGHADSIDVGSGSGTSGRRRLLELLRGSLLDHWDDEADDLDGRHVLESLQAIESLRDQLDADWASYLAHRLREPDGLELVLEVAHDLRSPLTSILFLSETLREGRSGSVNDLQRRQLGLVYSAALGVITIASDIIELARGGRRLSEKDPSPFSIGETLQSVREMVETMAEEKGVSLKFRGTDIDHRHGFPVPLSRVLLNLTTNALKFTEQGMVEITAEEREGEKVEFSVRDTGRGIPDEKTSDLFRPFQRADRPSGFAFSGTGLGLSIARKLVAAMGSELEFETDPDWGTRFYFQVDLPPVDGC